MQEGPRVGARGRGSGRKAWEYAPIPSPLRPRRDVSGRLEPTCPLHLSNPGGRLLTSGSQKRSQV